MSGRDEGRLTLRAIEVFVAVVEEGTLATGARRLGASPSSVSQQLANLEAALGAKLIDRSARPFALTPAGYVFQRRALAILDEAARAQSELAELELTALPRLRMAIVEDFDADVTPALVTELSRTLPDCAITAHSGPSHQNFAALETRNEDMIVAVDTDAALPEWIEQHPLMREPYFLVTCRGLLAPGEDPIPALMAAPMVRYASSQLMGQQIDTHLRRLRLAPERRFEFDSNHAILTTVVRARGWAISSPLGYLRAARCHGEVEVHPLPFKGFGRSISLFARRGVMGGLPARAAALMRREIARTILPAARAAAPWLGEGLHLLGEDPPPEEVPRLSNWRA